MAPTESRVAKPERRWDCRHHLPRPSMSLYQVNWQYTIEVTCTIRRIYL